MTERIRVLLADDHNVVRAGLHAVLATEPDLAVVGEIADRVMVMRSGEIREQGTAKAVFESPRDAYTKALLKCLLEGFRGGVGADCH